MNWRNDTGRCGYCDEPSEVDACTRCARILVEAAHLQERKKARHNWAAQRHKGKVVGPLRWIDELRLYGDAETGLLPDENAQLEMIL